jgi:tetratricopeptide (TPR) repeat protein
MDLPMTTPLPPEPQHNPAFREQVNTILSQWQGGTITYAVALESLNKLKQAAVDAQHLVHQALVENSLGIMQGYRSNYTQSLVHFENVRRLYEQAGAFSRLSGADLNIGETYRLRGNFTRARTYFHQAYESAKRYDNRANQTVALTNEAQMWLSLNSLDKAQETLSKALELSETPWENPEPDSRRLSRLDNACEIEYCFVELKMRQNKAPEAWQHARRAYEVAQELQRPIRRGFANRAMGSLVTVLTEIPDEGFAADPDSYFKAALEAFKEVKAEGEVGKTLYAHGKSYALRGKKRNAAQLFQQAMVIFTRLGMTDDAAKAAEAQLEVI